MSLITTDYFHKEAGREIDEFDDLKTKYFNSSKRGMGTLKSFVTKTERAISTASGVNRTYMMSLRS